MTKTEKLKAKLEKLQQENRAREINLKAKQEQNQLRKDFLSAVKG